MSEALDAESLAYLEEVLCLDPSEDALELSLARRAHLRFEHPPAHPPPFAPLPARLRVSASLDSLREQILGQEQPGFDELVSEVRGLAQPDQLVHLERLLCFRRQREAFATQREWLGEELAAVLEQAWLGKVGESVAAIEGYLETLERRPAARSTLGRRARRIRDQLPELAALEPELLLALERRGRELPQSGTANALLVIGLCLALYLILEHLFK